MQGNTSCRRIRFAGGCAQHGRSARTSVQLQATAQAQASAECAAAIDTLKQAANDTSVDKARVFQALRVVQKEKLPADDWDTYVGCNRFWRLVYTASQKTVQKDMKSKGQSDEKLSGYFFPLTAAQVFNLDNAPKGRIYNGVYLPFLAAIRFSGDYTHDKGSKKLDFEFDGVKVKIGPLRLGPFKVGGGTGEGGSQKAFFNFFYADDDIICAQGKGGGIAFWAKADEEFVVKKGLEV